MIFTGADAFEDILRGFGPASRDDAATSKTRAESSLKDDVNPKIRETKAGSSSDGFQNDRFSSNTTNNYTESEDSFSSSSGISDRPTGTTISDQSNRTGRTQTVDHPQSVPNTSSANSITESHTRDSSVEHLPEQQLGPSQTQAAPDQLVTEIQLSEMLVDSQPNPLPHESPADQINHPGSNSPQEEEEAPVSGRESDKRSLRRRVISIFKKLRSSRSGQESA